MATAARGARGPPRANTAKPDNRKETSMTPTMRREKFLELLARANNPETCKMILELFPDELLSLLAAVRNLNETAEPAQSPSNAPTDLFGTTTPAPPKTTVQARRSRRAWNRNDFYILEQMVREDRTVEEIATILDLKKR